MKIRDLLLGCALGVGLSVCGGTLLLAQYEHHPNLGAAIHFIDMASGKISTAQQANAWDMHGHAQHAQQLLGEARGELVAAIHDLDRR